MILLVLTSVSIALTASILGVFAVLKRMSLAGDAFSHIALPGIGLALLLNINPFIGAFLFLAVGALIVWRVELTSNLALESIIGVVFSLSLAIGALITPEQELLEAMFGDILALQQYEYLILLLISLTITLLLLLFSKQFILLSLSPELAQSIKIKKEVYELAYLLLFALTIALGIRFIGALLMGALIIIPAAAAKNISRDVRSFFITSSLIGVLSALSSMYTVLVYKQSPGPIFIIISSLFFFFSLFWQRVRQKA